MTQDPEKAEPPDVSSTETETVSDQSTHTDSEDEPDPASTPEPDSNETAGDAPVPDPIADADTVDGAGADDPLAKAPRRRRVGLWALLSVGLLSVVVVLGGLSALGQPIVAPDWLRARIAARINQDLGNVRVSFGQMSFLVGEDWHPRLSLQDVEVKDGLGAPLVTLGDVQTTLAPQPILRGKVRPASISLQGAQLVLRRAKDGSFGLAFGDAMRPVGQSNTLNGLISSADQVLIQPQFSELNTFEAEGLTVRYEDARAGQAWSADGGRLSLLRNGADLQIRGDFALLGGNDYATVLEMSYASQIGELKSDFGMSFQDMAANDIARQIPAMAWLEALRAPIAGALRVSVDETGALGPLSATLQIGEGVMQPADQTRPIPFQSARSYFTFSPATNSLQFDELSVKTDWGSARAEGRAVLRGMEQGWPSELLGQVQFDQITANPDAMYPQPVQLGGATADFRLSLDPFALSLGQISIPDEEGLLLLSGKLDIAPKGWRLALDGRLDQVRPDRVLELWPPHLATNTRNWIATNVHDARLSNVQAALRTTAGQRPDLYLGFEFDDAEVSFLKSMPPVQNAAGVGSLFRDRFVISASEGQITARQGGRVDVAGTSFTVPSVRVKGGPAHVDLQTDGSITAGLSLLDSDVLKLISKAGQPVTLADGRARLSGTLDFPLKKQLQADAVKFDIAGQLSAMRSDKLVPGYVLSSGGMRIAANNASIQIEGPGQIGTVPFRAAWEAPLSPAGAPSTVTGTVQLSQKFVDEFRIGLPKGSVTGAGPAQFEITLPKGKAPSFTMSSRLDGVGMRFAPLGWSLAKKTKGRLDVSGALGAPPRIDRLSLKAPGLSATGSVTLTSNGTLDRAKFSRVQAGGWLDAPVELTGRGKNATPAVAVTGGWVDMRKTSLGEGGNASGAGGGPISLALDRLQITDSIRLTGFRGQFSTAGGMKGDFRANVNGAAPVTGVVRPQGTRSAFEIRSDNAGGVLSAAGLLKRAKKGSFLLTLTPYGSGGSFDGRLKVRNVWLRDAPAMAALLNAVSVVGLLEQLGGTGILFGEVDAKFRLTPTQVIVTKGSAVGASMGISMDGIYDLVSGKMDMQGVFSPIYLVNGIGSIFTRKGEGLLGFSYKLRGTAEKPRVIVNPLSIFTPGMFREIFRRPPPKVSK